jgi:hypothetical protein
MRTLNTEEIKGLEKQLAKLSQTKRNQKTPHGYLCS